MISEKQLLANQNNAKRSTGPRTPEGKALASQNNLKHGLLAQKTVIKGENQADFDLYHEQMLTELAPATRMESMLSDRIIALSWRLDRATHAQTLTYNAMKYNRDNPRESKRRLQSLLASTGNQPPSDPSIPWPDLTLGHIAMNDFADSRVLDRLLMYERRIEHSLFKTILQLQRLQYLRKAGFQKNPLTKLCDTNPFSKVGKPSQHAVQ